ncbi:hypothetical protein J4437_02285 [Candidatus Woesearchaeota archaeon]|nr:hypothetical protein [Candidatus Woesearchaeota archaeon]
MDPNPQDLNQEQLLHEALGYLEARDYGAAKFYGNMAVTVGIFYQALVDNKSPIAPDAEGTRLYLDAANAVVKAVNTFERAISQGDLEDKLKVYTDRYERLKEQLGTEYSIKLATIELISPEK